MHIDYEMFVANKDLEEIKKLSNDKIYDFFATKLDLIIVDEIVNNDDQLHIKYQHVLQLANKQNLGITTAINTLKYHPYSWKYFENKLQNISIEKLIEFLKKDNMIKKTRGKPSYTLTASYHVYWNTLEFDGSNKIEFLTYLFNSYSYRIQGFTLNDYDIEKREKFFLELISTCGVGE